MYIARHTKEQVSLILGIHDGGEVANCYGKFYDVDSDRILQVPCSSIVYSRENLDTRMAIGTIDIVGRMSSRIGTSDDDCPVVEFSIRSDMMMDIGQYRVQSISWNRSRVKYIVYDTWLTLIHYLSKHSITDDEVIFRIASARSILNYLFI